MGTVGYKEGIQPLRLMPLRTRQNDSPEAEPLTRDNATRSNSFKPVPPSLNVRWHRNGDTTIETQLSPDPGLGESVYVECGPSPPAENTPSLCESFEETISELSLQVCNDTLRSNLLEQMRDVGGRTSLLEDIERGNVVAQNLSDHFEAASQSEKNLSYLWSAILKRWDLLPGFLDSGADLQYCDLNGMGALHLGAFSGCLSTLSLLLDKGADVNLQPVFYTPLHCAAFGNAAEAARFLISKGAQLAVHTKKPHGAENLLQCAVRANAFDCLQLFVAAGADVNAVEPNGTNAIHLAAELGHVLCLATLLRAPGADPDVRTCVGEKESTALHLAADGNNAECVKLLLAHGADVALQNHRGFTALHIASRTSSLKCVDTLLRHGNADPDATDFDQRTPLHAAVGRSEGACLVLDTLLLWGANVNLKDKQGYTALHLAALDGLVQCVELMISRGADVTTKSKKGTSALNVIVRKTPAAVTKIRQQLDAAITLLHPKEDAASRELEMELDFRQLLRHCHPREISYLNTFVDEGQKELLEHPLCSAFLYIKWGKMRKYYIGRLIFCFVFVLGLSLYVLTALAHNCYNGSKDEITVMQEQAQELCQKQSMLGDMLRNNPFVMEMQWWVLVAITLVEICRKLYGISQYSTVRHYLLQVENLIEWFVIVSVFAISYIYTKQTYTFQNHIGAIAVLLGWTNLMLMVGQLPVFDVYVAMYMRVLAEFTKIFAAYFCMLIGFTISFCVIFPADAKFSNPLMGFITVLVLMVGEVELDLLINDPDGKDPPFLLEVSAQITFVLFILFVTVILMNLLVGIAVHDIRGLKQTAGLSKLVRQTKLISCMESALFMGHLPTWLRKRLHRSALVSPQAKRVVLCVKPLNPCEKRLPRDILMRAYDIGKVHQTVGHANDSQCDPQCDRSQRCNPANRSPDAAHLAALTTTIDESIAGVELLAHQIDALKRALIAQQQQTCQAIDKLSTEVFAQYKTKSFGIGRE